HAAHDLLPGFVPAAVRLAQVAPRLDRAKNAIKAVERTWRSNPHPELAEAYRSLDPVADAPTQVARAERLAALAADSIEGPIAIARAAL
ncbi:hypothetical protein ABTM31_20620, partial [Acinetobacter baumannii]